MSRREFLEVLRGQLSGQMTQGRAAAHVRYYEDYIQSQSGTAEVNQMFWQNWGIPADCQDFDRYR